MANRSGRTGRDGEHIVRRYLSDAGFENVEREGKRAPSNDVVAQGLATPVEVKRQAVLAIPQWTRKVAAVHGDRWTLWVIQRDARKKVHPDVMIVPAALGAAMLKLWEERMAQ